MEKAYIILAHNNPGQLYRLIQRLDDGRSAFFIHLDKKTSYNDFQDLFYYGQRLTILKRIATDWAGFGLVEATLNGLKAIKQTGEDFDRIILLSGLDYPIKNNEAIDRFFDESKSRIFIEYVTIPDYERWKPQGGLYRINKYFLGIKKQQKYRAKALNFLSAFLPFVRRKLPEKTKTYAGSQWWMIDMYALNYILNYIQLNPEYIKFHKYTFAADEVFFHTLLLNAKDDRILRSIENNNKRFTKWENTLLDGHPATLTTQDFESIKKSDALFARKFNVETDAEIIELINRHCLHNEALQNNHFI